MGWGGMGSRFDLWQWDINEGITGKGAVSGFGYDINIGRRVVEGLGKGGRRKSKWIYVGDQSRPRSHSFLSVVSWLVLEE